MSKASKERGLEKNVSLNQPSTSGANIVMLEYGIEQCIVLSFNFTLPSPLPEKIGKADAAVDVKIRIHEDLQRIEVFLTISLSIGESSEKISALATIVTTTVFRVNGLENAREGDENVLLHNTFMLNLINIALGMSRGMLITFLGPTPFGGVIVLPLVPDNKLLPRDVNAVGRFKIGALHSPPPIEENTINLPVQVESTTAGTPF